MMRAGKHTARDQGGIGPKWGTRNTVLALVVKPHLLYGVNVQRKNYQRKERSNLYRTNPAHACLDLIQGQIV